MSNVLTLATAGVKPEQLADSQHLCYPRIDYLELQRLLSIDIIDYTAYNRTSFGRLLRNVETQIRSDLYLTWLALLKHSKYNLIFTMSERVGIPFTAFHRLLSLPKPLVTMFTAWSERQERMITSLKLFTHMDSIIVHCTSMKQHFVSLGARPEKIHVIRYGVDHRFFTPQTDVEQEPGFLLSLGEVRGRDYPTLFQAVDGLPVKLLVAASGRWYAREKQKRVYTTIPDNVIWSGGFSLLQLRELYARAQIVVLPIHDVVFSAGATAILEAMCMGRAVIVTRSRGIQDFIIDGETCLVVEPGSSAEMREAIRYLLANPAEARRIGQNARQRVEEELNLDVHVSLLAQHLQTYL